MGSIDLHAEAVKCRRYALEFMGKPEATFLLRVAREFDRLAQKRGESGGERDHRLCR